MTRLQRDLDKQTGKLSLGYPGQLPIVLCVTENFWGTKREQRSMIVAVIRRRMLYDTVSKFSFVT